MDGPRQGKQGQNATYSPLGVTQVTSNMGPGLCPGPTSSLHQSAGSDRRLCLDGGPCACPCRTWPNTVLISRSPGPTSSWSHFTTSYVDLITANDLSRSTVPSRKTSASVTPSGSGSVSGTHFLPTATHSRSVFQNNSIASPDCLLTSFTWTWR